MQYKRFIGIAGSAGVGKDTVAQFIAEIAPEGTVVSAALADPLKQALSIWWGIPDGTLYGPSCARSAQIGNLTFANGDPITVRKALQLLGTEFGRDMLYTNVWVDITLQRVAHMMRFPTVQTVVVTDCRLDNEFQAVRDARGELWHVTRPGFEPGGDHRSERDQGGQRILQLRTHHIANDGTLDDLRALVAQCYNTPTCSYPVD